MHAHIIPHANLIPMNIETPETEEKKDNPLISLLLGLGLIGFGVYLYWDLSQMEASGGSQRINWLVAAAYKLAGKTGAAGIFGLVGACFVWGGIRGWMKKD